MKNTILTLLFLASSAFATPSFRGEALVLEEGASYQTEGYVLALEWNEQGETCSEARAWLKPVPGGFLLLAGHLFEVPVNWHTCRNLGFVSTAEEGRTRLLQALEENDGEI